MYTKLYSAHLLGVEGHIVEIEVDISNGLPQFEIVGLPGSALKEAKERVRAAIRNSGYRFPAKRVTVNLAPAHIRKEGAYFDLAIAIAVLIADEQVRVNAEMFHSLERCLFIGELALDGKTRTCDGIIPLLLAADDKGFEQVIVPTSNALGIEIGTHVSIHAVSHFKQLTASISEGKLPIAAHTICSRTNMDNQHDEGMEDVIGHEHVKRALEVSAAGFHHALMVGPPGSGKTMLAKRLPGVLPQLTDGELIEVMKIRSVIGENDSPVLQSRKRPFRSPHHSITATGMMGGGTPVKPGEVSVAHRGVLFLDELLEFTRSVIESLREPLEDGSITLTRAHHRFTFPARFLLILALNPCPCGFFGYETDRERCTCTSNQIERYWNKCSGPLLDRIDIHIEVPRMSFEQISNPVPKEDRYTTKAMRERVAESIRFKRARGGPPHANGLLSARDIPKYCKLTTDAQDFLRMSFERLQLSNRAYHKIIKLSRTIADLNESEQIGIAEISEAIHYRSLDRKRV